MNVACDYEAPMQMLTTEKYIAGRSPPQPARKAPIWMWLSQRALPNPGALSELVKIFNSTNSVGPHLNVT